MNNVSPIKKLKHILLDEDRSMTAQHIDEIRLEIANKNAELSRSLKKSIKELALANKKLEKSNDEIKDLRAALSNTRNELVESKSVIHNHGELISKLNNDIFSNELFNEKLAGSQTQLIDLLGPQFGRLIRRSIQNEVDKISAKIESTKASLGPTNILNKIKSKFGYGKKVKISDIAAPEIVDVIAIDNETGLLLGRFSQQEHTDMDILAGMLDAIRSFAETAFVKKNNQLDLIEYDRYKIKLYGYGSIYYAVIITGRVIPEFKIFIENELDEFTNTIYSTLSSSYSTEDITARMTEEMQIYFRETCKKLERKLYS